MQPLGDKKAVVSEWKKNREVREKANQIIEKGVKKDKDLIQAVAEYGITRQELDRVVEENLYKREIVNRLIMN